ncbi:Transcriptional regulator invF [Serratia fonticola]|nr:Transcriptional regulator invF [Serratia fonticola]
MGVNIQLGNLEDGIVYSLPPGESGIFVCSTPTLRVTKGSMDYTALDINTMCKLQVFLDISQGFSDFSDAECQSVYGVGFEPLRMQGALSLKQLESWMIQQFLIATPGMKKISAILRGMECYWLIKFLIQQTDASEQTDASDSLRSLSKRYGLSVSHFRRVSRQALGNTTKKELKSWRLVRALLDNMGEKSNLTDLAFKHGYSSLSHFSSEVKIMFNLSPRALKNVIANEVKK